MYISTTAGGDGLEFDSRLGTVVEEIEKIKRSPIIDILPTNIEDKKPLKTLKEDREFAMEDLSPSLNPLFVLLEAMENLELIKNDV